MKSTVSSTNALVQLGLRLVLVYIATAFVFWKSGCFYIYGDAGLSFTFSSSPWSTAVGAGYVAALFILAVHAALQFKSGRYQGITRTLIFGGLGLLLFTLGAGFSYTSINVLSALAGLGINALLLYCAFKGWRYFRTRAFVYWVWAFAINLVREIGIRWLTEANSSASGVTGGFGRFLVFTHLPGRSSHAHSWWFPELYWLGHIVSSVLIVAGVILLIGQLRSSGRRAQSPNTAKYAAAGVLLMLVGIYPSLAYFGSPGIVTTFLATAVMLWCSVLAWRRWSIAGFAFWAWASGLALLVMLGGLLQHNRVYPPGGFDQTTLALIQLMSALIAMANLVAGILWVAGLMLILRYLPSAIPLRPTTAGRAQTVVLLPRPPAWMRKRLTIIVAVGGLAISIVWLRQNNPAEVFSTEPKYE
jgi:hypothetical protein